MKDLEGEDLDNERRRFGFEPDKPYWDRGSGRVLAKTSATRRVEMSKKKYVVRITARITHDIEIEAYDEDEADTSAHEEFSVYESPPGEQYEKFTESITEVKANG